MKKLKKIVAIAAAMAMMLSFTACSGGGGEEEGAGEVNIYMWSEYMSPEMFEKFL